MFWFFEDLVYWYCQALRRYADCNGRDSRKAYWMFMLANSMINWILFLGERALGTTIPWIATIHPVSHTYTLLTLVPFWAAMVRRLHDVGRSGAWVVRCYVIPGAVALVVYVVNRVQAGHHSAVPLVGLGLLTLALFLLSLVVQFAFLTRASQRGKNRYGPQPKAY